MLIWIEGTYEGVDFRQWTMDNDRWVPKPIKRSDSAKGFVLLPKRWVVERTWGWLNWSRCLVQDYEGLTDLRSLHQCRDDAPCAQTTSFASHFSDSL